MSGNYTWYKVNFTQLWCLTIIIFKDKIKFSLFPLLFSLLYEESNGHVEAYGTVHDQGKN